ncbi:unnamed protein product [Protopolystoma xenopodis]|uniref:Uncharacterized protein n=1 Tax=Protopolystoma xenopodis TaxID=117903 RepID=A0A3S4ZMN9_9PLAT|nr:unnamed protein product [Protopolystoma xenopodis]
MQRLQTNSSVLADLFTFSASQFYPRPSEEAPSKKNLSNTRSGNLGHSLLTTTTIAELKGCPKQTPEAA